MTYTHEMIDQALICILREIAVKATVYKDNIKNREYTTISGHIRQLKEGEPFISLVAMATIQDLIDKMVEYERIRKYGVK